MDRGKAEVDPSDQEGVMIVVLDKASFPQLQPATYTDESRKRKRMSESALHHQESSRRSSRGHIISEDSNTKITPVKTIHKKSRKSEPAQSSQSRLPSSQVSATVYPPEFNLAQVELMRKLAAEKIQNENRKISEVQERLNDPRLDWRLRELLQSVKDTNDELHAEQRLSGRNRRLYRLKERLEQLFKTLEWQEAEVAAEEPSGEPSPRSLRRHSQVSYAESSSGQGASDIEGGKSVQNTEEQEANYASAEENAPIKFSPDSSQSHSDAGFINDESDSEGNVTATLFPGFFDIEAGVGDDDDDNDDNKISEEADKEEVELEAEEDSEQESDLKAEQDDAKDKTDEEVDDEVSESSQEDSDENEKSDVEIMFVNKPQQWQAVNAVRDSDPSQPHVVVEASPIPSSTQELTSLSKSTQNGGSFILRDLLVNPERLEAMKRAQRLNKQASSRNVYDVPDGSSDGSDSEDDDEVGDVFADGTSTKLRQPRRFRT